MPFDPNTATLVQPTPAAGPGGFDPSTAVQEETLGEKLQYLPGFAKETGQKLGASIMRGAAGMADLNPFGGGGAIDLGSKLGRLVTGRKEPTMMESPTREAGRGAAEKAAAAVDVPDTLDEKGNRSLFDSGIRGLGYALGGAPIPGAGVVPNIMSGLASGWGGELGRRAGARFGPTGEIVGETLGGLGAGGATGFALGPKQTPGQADIRRAMNGTTDAEFRAAQEAANAAQRSGSTTATAAEMFDPNSGVMALAKQIRGSNMNNALRTRTVGRDEDIQRLSDTFQNRIGAPVDANQVANNAANAANGALGVARDARSAGIRNRLGQAPDVTDRDVTGLYSDLYRSGDAQIRPAAGNAYREVAEGLVAQDGSPITNTQQLSLAIKSMRDAPRNPNSRVNNPGANISKGDFEQAVRDAESGFAGFSPDFRGAMDDFRDYSQRVMRPMESGPIGSLADRNPLNAGQTPISRLEGLVNGNSPATVEGTGRVLGNPVLTGNQQVSPADIARAIAQNKLKGAPTNPGQAVRGNAGSPMEDQFGGLLRAADLDPNHVTEPLRVADRLQPFTSAAGISEPPKMNLAQLIRPFRTADMALTGRGIKATNEEISTLLADPANLPRLREIAMFDPNIRRILSARGMLGTGQEQ